MANEVSISASLSVSKGGIQVNGNKATSFTLSGTEMFSATQQFSTSEAAISLGGCDQVGWLLIINMDASATITVGYANPIVTVASVIPPGGVYLTSGCSTTLYAKSSAGTVDTFVVCVES